MSSYILRLFQILVFSVFSTSAFAQEFPYSRYKPATLQEALEGLIHFKDKKCDFTFGLAGAAFKVRVQYTGKIRDIEKPTRDFLAAWHKAGYAGQGTVPTQELFSSEILVSVGPKSYWFPTQHSLIPYLREEFPNGGAIDIYIAGIGAMRENLVIIINAYGAPE